MMTKRSLFLSSLLVLAAMAPDAARADQIVGWKGSSVVLRWTPDPAAPPMRQSLSDMPPRAPILEEINGYVKFHAPSLNGDVFVLRRDVLTESGNAAASNGAVYEPCVQRGPMGMTACSR